VGWRADFCAVAVLAVLTLGLAGRYVPVDRRVAPGTIDLGEVRANYRSLLGSRRFLAYALAATGASAGFQIFSAGGSAVLVGSLGMSPETFGLYAMLPPAGFLVGSYLSQRYTQRCGVDRMVAYGGMVLVAGGVSQVVLAGLVGTPLSIVGPMTLICSGSGMLTPNAVAGALSVRPEMAGAASGLASFIQLSGAAAATTALSCIPGHSAVALAAVIASVGMVAAIAALMLTLTGSEAAVAVASLQPQAARRLTS
jgi:DHA1 family bicyclomycin/chloramphenicol resistance-like MFS transporter